MKRGFDKLYFVKGVTYEKTCPDGCAFCIRPGCL